MEHKKLVERLCSNSWRWDYMEFARRAGLNHEDPSARDLFLLFRQAADALGRFDDRLLAVIFQE